METLASTRRAVILAVLAAAALGLAAAGCAGEPPSISNLSLSPTTIVAGEATQVNGGLDFEDPDGDVTELFFELALGGEVQGQDSQEVAGAEGVTAGQAAFILLLQPPEAGDVDVSVWIVDAEGNESNTLSSTLTAE